MLVDREFRWSLGGFPLIGLGSEVNTNKHQPRFTQTQSPNVYHVWLSSYFNLLAYTLLLWFIILY